MILVAAYDDALGCPDEMASGYFDAPFDWDAIQSNCQHIVQFSGEKDTLVPIEVQRRVAEHLKPKGRYIEMPSEDHFFEPPLEGIVKCIMEFSNN